MKGKETLCPVWFQPHLRNVLEWERAFHDPRCTPQPARSAVQPPQPGPTAAAVGSHAKERGETKLKPNRTINTRLETISVKDTRDIDKEHRKVGLFTPRLHL